jgi:hypothetical protein
MSDRGVGVAFAPSEPRAVRTPYRTFYVGGFSRIFISVPPRSRSGDLAECLMNVGHRSAFELEASDRG